MLEIIEGTRKRFEGSKAKDAKKKRTPTLHFILSNTGILGLSQ